MTYKQLLTFLNAMSDEELEQDVTTRLDSNGEYFPVGDEIPMCDDGVLDDGHPFLTVKDRELE